MIVVDYREAKCKRGKNGDAVVAEWAFTCAQDGELHEVIVPVENKDEVQKYFDAYVDPEDGVL